MCIDTCMYSEREQILLSPEQRCRLDEEVAARNIAVAAVVREALDEHLGSGDMSRRQAAARRMFSRNLKVVSPEELADIAQRAVVAATVHVLCRHERHRVCRCLRVERARHRALER